MAIHKHSSVNPLVNPVSSGDIIIAESGERYIIRQNMAGYYWIAHARSNAPITAPVDGQVAICGAISDLINL